MVRRQINENELQTLFILIGEAIWHLQNVEEALHCFITVKKDLKTRGAVPEEEADKLLKKNQRRTLGQSLYISREVGVLTSKLQERLEKFNEERKWLVHKCVPSNREDLYVDSTRYALMKRIKKFSEEAGELHKSISKELEDFVCTQGVSRDTIYSQAVSTIMKLKGIKA